jgi:predicted HTH transcriptional regulator
MMGIAMFKQVKVVTDDIYQTAVAVAKSSVSSRYTDVIKAMRKEDVHTTSEIQKEVGLPNSTIDILLGNLAMLGAIRKNSDSGKPTWEIKQEIIDIMEFCNL